ncbi:MAG: 4-hydroxybenzoate 3-monooxygenase [Actinobacteria bacterium 21-73-9]|nr:MAG: 4-hydroxybenzoate 3-monooxygenase [Actinobacteria bacterium 21-73-9]
MRVPVAIVGAGPVGLVLGHLLDAAGVEAVVLERRSRAYVEQRVRAGVIEYGIANFLAEIGVGERLRAKGLVHHGIELRFEGRSHRVPLSELSGGHPITVYGQTELVKDLNRLRLEADRPLLFETEVEAIEGLGQDRPVVVATGPEGPVRVEADWVVGADGAHGVAARCVPEGVFSVASRTYPYAWLGILAEAPPATEELIYCRHERGFALYSMRSPTISRLYLGVDPSESLENWSDDRIWSELNARLATAEMPTIEEGPVVERSITAMRSIVRALLCYRRLVLAGDAVHIVPPTGAKGMNLALAYVRRLAPALAAEVLEGDGRLLDAYSDACLRRIWRAEEFSTYMTQMLHPHPSDDFENGVQLARLRQAVSVRSATETLARNYVDLSSIDLADG